MLLQTKRIHEEPRPKDGKRVLVDRTWPSGINRYDARVDLWLRDIAPAPRLRQKLQPGGENWNDFLEMYRDQLYNSPDGLSKLRELMESSDRMTLLFTGRDPKYNSATALKRILEKDRLAVGS